MARSRPPFHGDPDGKDSSLRRGLSSGTLRLSRTEDSGKEGILLVFDASKGGEESWLLEQSSVVEILALLLGGRIGGSQRVMLDARATLEPPNQPGGKPLLCFSAGALEGCIATDEDVLKTLRRDIDRLVPR